MRHYIAQKIIPPLPKPARIYHCLEQLEPARRDCILHAYVDGRLDPARRAAVAAWLEAHPEQAAQVEGWKRDAERLRVARELHDVAGHKLTAMKLNLRALASDPVFAARDEVRIAQQLDYMT